MVLQFYVKDGDLVEKGATICKWDPYNGVIVSEFTEKWVMKISNKDNHS